MKIPVLGIMVKMECFIVFWFYINNIVIYIILFVGHSSKSTKMLPVIYYCFILVFVEHGISCSGLNPEENPECPKLEVECLFRDHLVLKENMVRRLAFLHKPVSNVAEVLYTSNIIIHKYNQGNSISTSPFENLLLTREGFLRKNIVVVSFFQNCAINPYY